MAAFPSPGNTLVIPSAAPAVAGLAGNPGQALEIPQRFMPSAGFPTQPSSAVIATQTGLAPAPAAPYAGGAPGLTLAGFAAEAIPILLELLGPAFALLIQQTQASRPFAASGRAPHPSSRAAPRPKPRGAR